MKPFERWFIALVIVADFTAIVYFGGNFLVHGTLGTPEEVEQEVAIEEEFEEAHVIAAAFDPSTYTANPAKGQKIAGKCKACHTFESGEPNRIGPNLWKIVGSPITHKSDFAYSSAFTSHAGQIIWNEEELDTFLTKPGVYIPGTKMSFAGIKKPEDRADLIAWLKTLK